MNRPLIPIFLIVLVDVLGLMLIVPLLPLYAESMGASPFVASLLFTSYAACQLLAGPILGQISDRLGRKPVLIVSQMGTLLGFVLLATANSLPLVFLSRIIDGLTAGNMSVAHAYIADVTEPKNRARAFGVVGVAFGIGFLVGPALAGLLAAYGHRWPIYAAIVASGASILATALLLPSAAPRPETPASAVEPGIFNPAAFATAFRNRSLALLLLQFTLFSLAFSGFFAGISLYAERRYFRNGVPFGVHEVGWLMAVMGLGAIVTQVFVLGRALRKFGERRLVSMAYVGVGLGFLVLALPKPPIAPFLAMIVLGLSSSLVRPPLIGLITQHVTNADQGMIMGLVQSLVSVCQIVAPMIGGFLIEQGQLTAWTFFSAALIAAGWAVGRFFRRSEPLG